MGQKPPLDFICIGAVGIDTNVYLFSDKIDFTIETNFSDNVDSIGQAGGYSSFILKSLGCNVGFIDSIGLDYHGYYIKDSFKQLGIDCLWFTDPKGTKRSINIMNKAGERKIFYDGKGSMKTIPDLNQCRIFLKQTNIIHVNIVNWARNLLPIAKELGILISCDIQDIVDPNDGYRKDFIKAAGILFLSAVNITNIESFIESLRKSNSDAIIIIGMGKKGAGLSVKERSIKYYPPPHLHYTIIDTNGAGDSLATGFLFGRLHGHSFEESLLLGQINAQHTCSLKAPKTNFIKHSELISLFNKIKEEYFASLNN